MDDIKTTKYRFQSLVETILFSSRWLLVPFYLGLMVALVIYLFIDAKEVVKLCTKVLLLDKEATMLVLLELVDMAMIAALVKMIITGGYTSFVNKQHGQNNDKASSGTLKVKMSTSLVGVSSIHLLQKFIDIKEVAWTEFAMLLLIHFAFLYGSLILARIEKIHVESEVLEQDLSNH